MKEKRFVVNPEEKVVVAIIDASEKGVTDEVVSKCSKSTMYATLNMIMNAYDCSIPELEIPYNATYKGVSKCDSHDDFNEKAGKEIAGSKANMKYHVAMAKKYKRLADIFKKAQEEMYILETNHTLAVNNIKDRLSKYYS